MDPTSPFARFPLIARARPACVPLPQRVANLCERARKAVHTGDLTDAAAVHNQAALIASDCGLPNLARTWCHRHASNYLHAGPLNAQEVRLALEPIINLARLNIREGHGEHAFELIDALFHTVSDRAEATIDGIEIPADLTDSPDTHQQTRSWLWAVLLSTGGRALAAAGQWTKARDRLAEYNGIGQRMLDGRQIAIIAHATEGDTDTARALLADTTPGQPWENAVTSCLTIHLHKPSRLAAHLARYDILDATAPGLTVFHTRLGLSFVDVLSTIDDAPRRRVATDLIERTITSQDGYAARDLLAHPRCRAVLADEKAHDLCGLVKSCALGSRALSEPVLDVLGAALTNAEGIIQSHLTSNTPDRPRRRAVAAARSAISSS